MFEFFYKYNAHYLCVTPSIDDSPWLCLLWYMHMLIRALGSGRTATIGKGTGDTVERKRR